MCSGCAGDYCGGFEEPEPESAIPEQPSGVTGGTYEVFVSARRIVVYGRLDTIRRWQTVEEVVPPADKPCFCCDLPAAIPVHGRSASADFGEQSRLEIAKYYQTSLSTRLRIPRGRWPLRVLFIGSVLVAVYGGTLLAWRIF